MPDALVIEDRATVADKHRDGLGSIDRAPASDRDDDVAAGLEIGLRPGQHLDVLGIGRDRAPGRRDEAGVSQVPACLAGPAGLLHPGVGDQQRAYGTKTRRGVADLVQDARTEDHLGDHVFGHATWPVGARRRSP